MKIDIYTHVVPPGYKLALAKVAPGIDSQLRVPTLYDMDRRFRIMDRLPGVSQVITLTKTASNIFEDPQVGPDFVRRANDEIAELVGKHPDRFAAGVASVPINNMDAAVSEIERAVKVLGLRGVQLYTPVRQDPVDLERFGAIFEAMTQHDLPVWIHPDVPADRSSYARFFHSHVFGWPYESTGAMTHLAVGGLFEKYPSAKVIMHHCGAAAPFFDQRIVEAYDGSPTIFGLDHNDNLSRPLVDYFRMFYTDTALGGSVAGLMCGYAFFGAEHLLFGSDSPYDAELGERSVRRTIESIESMEITDKERQLIFEGNARRLLRLP